MHINYHARSVTRANLTRATLASSLDASKSDGSNPLSFIYLEKARQSFFSQTVEAKNMADF